MKIINYFECSENDREYWLGKIGECDWNGGIFLKRLLSENRFSESCGESSKLLLLTDGDKLISFCSYAEKDDIQPTLLGPWIGFVYTFPEYRGNHFFGLLMNEAERIAQKENVSEIYISTGHKGLYEKYGCEYFAEMNDICGEPSRIYVKRIKRNDP